MIKNGLKWISIHFNHSSQWFIYRADSSCRISGDVELTHRGRRWFFCPAGWHSLQTPAQWPCWHLPGKTCTPCFPQGWLSAAGGDAQRRRWRESESGHSCETRRYQQLVNVSQGCYLQYGGVSMLMHPQKHTCTLSKHTVSLQRPSSCHYSRLNLSFRLLSDAKTARVYYRFMLLALLMESSWWNWHIIQIKP